jgi:hypothetical protein
MSKKAQGMSLNTIIIAIIVLIVLVVLILLFTGNLRVFGKGTATCESRGGTCFSGSNGVDCISLVNKDDIQKSSDTTYGECANNPATGAKLQCCPAGYYK